MDDRIKNSWQFLYEDLTGDAVWRLKQYLVDCISYKPDDIIYSVFKLSGVPDGLTYSQYLKRYSEENLPDFSDSTMEDNILHQIISKGAREFTEDELIILSEIIGLTPVDNWNLFRKAIVSCSGSLTRMCLPAILNSLLGDDIGLVPTLQMGTKLKKDSKWDGLSRKFNKRMSPSDHINAIIIAIHRNHFYVIKSQEEALSFVDILLKSDTIHTGSDRVLALLLSILQADKRTDQRKVSEYYKQNPELLITSAGDSEIMKLEPWFTEIEDFLLSRLPSHEITIEEIIGRSWGSKFPVTPGTDYIPGINETVKKDPDKFLKFMSYVNRISGFESEDNLHSLIRMFTGHEEIGWESMPRWDCRKFGYLALWYIIKFLFKKHDRNKFQLLKNYVSFENDAEDLPWEQASKETTRKVDPAILQSLHDFYPEIFK